MVLEFGIKNIIWERIVILVIVMEDNFGIINCL